jgi:triosephosphate isomerase
MSARKKLLAGNWKMNKLNSELRGFFEAFSAALGPTPPKAEILFAASFTLLVRARELAAIRGIEIAAQNVHFDSAGAFTGEVSLPMLKDIGITATLIGHSERRQFFGESDAAVAKKAKAALREGVKPIVCVGETLAEREAGRTEAVIGTQIDAVMSGLGHPQALGDLVIAYEPVWAIGTGRSATSAQAQDVHHFIRQRVAELSSRAAADGLRILYGGSANPGNIAELLAQTDIDGALVGGASLKAADFAAMVRAAG